MHIYLKDTISFGDPTATKIVKRRSGLMNMLRRTAVPYLAAASLFTSAHDLRAQDTNMVPSFKPFDGIGYSPFHQAGQNPNYGIYPTVDQISSDITNQLQYLTKAVRTFGDTMTLSNIPSLCYQYNIDCYPCAWLGGTSADTDSLNILIAIANYNFKTTKGLLVGSEALQGNLLSASQLLADVRYVRAGPQIRSQCARWDRRYLERHNRLAQPGDKPGLR